jgi:prepilin-type N-terminal cleavage/methylation domain-containing protein
MRRPQSGFTLIELLIVISIITLLAAVLLPNILTGQAAANALADQRNLGRHFEWLTDYKRKMNGALPREGGHKFVLTSWTTGVATHTPENLDRFFSPGLRDDGIYQDARAMVDRGEDPWPTLQHTNSTDTHYAGRAKEHLVTASRGENEALMADDNEGIWCLPDGTVNILFNGGAVRSYSYPQLQEKLSLGPLDLDNPIQTYGPNSPIEECQKLDK